MKKSVILTALAAVMGMSASAVDFTASGLNFSTISDTEVKVVKTTGLSGVVTIPATVTNDGVTYTVTTLGSGCFSQNKTVTNYEFPATLTTIEGAAFYQNNGLKVVNVPATITSIAPRAWAGCMFITEFIVDPANPNYCNFDGCLYNKTKTTLMKVPTTKTTIELPNTLTTIANEGFISTNVTSVNLPNSLTTVEQHGLQQNKFTSLVLPESITRLEPYAIAENRYVQNFELSNSITFIGEYNFWSWSQLTEFTIPASVKTISTNAFNNSNNITRLNFKSTTPPSVSALFIVNGSRVSLLPNISVYVPQGAKAAYQANSVFATAKEIVEDATLGIADVIAADETPVYYNLNGQVVENPQNGLFIKKVGAKATKVVL